MYKQFRMKDVKFTIQIQLCVAVVTEDTRRFKHTDQLYTQLHIVHECE